LSLLGNGGWGQCSGAEIEKIYQFDTFACWANRISFRAEDTSIAKLSGQTAVFRLPQQKMTS
jgi:hypothetical protein